MPDLVNTGEHISLLWVGSILPLVLARLTQELLMVSRCLLVLQVFRVDLFAEVLVFLRPLLSLSVRLLSYLTELFELCVYYLVNFCTLSQEHRPFGHVVDGFIVVGDQVSLNQGTVSHEQALSSWLGGLTDLTISQRCIFSLFAVCVCLLDELSIPMIMRCAVNLCSCKKLRESVCELSHEGMIQWLSWLWIGIIQAVVNSLSNDVVEFFEKLFFAFLIILWILNECERDIIGSNPIQ